MAYELSKRFQEHHEVRIAVYKDHIDPEWESELDIYKLRCKGLLALRELRRLINEFKPDIIHSHDWLGLLVANKNIPHVATTHSHWPSDWFYSPKAFAAGLIQGIPNEIKLHFVDQVIAVSEYDRQLIHRRGIQSYVIYNGVDSQFFERISGEMPFLKNPSIISVGGIDKRKADYLLPLIKLLINKNPKIAFYIIGSPQDRQIVAKLINIENACYLGIVEDVRPYLQKADVFISTSKMELFGLAAVEAQASGLPVVAFDICSFPEIIKNGKSGFLIDYGNLEEMCKKILEIINNKSLKEEMSINAVENAKRFLWDYASQEYLGLFSSIIFIVSGAQRVTNTPSFRSRMK